MTVLHSFVDFWKISPLHLVAPLESASQNCFDTGDIEVGCLKMSRSTQYYYVLLCD